MNKFIQIIKIPINIFFLFFSNNLKAEEKIKIGLLVPLSGEKQRNWSGNHKSSKTSG